MKRKSGPIVKGRRDDDGLPPGVNRQPSPLWDFWHDPVSLLGYVLRHAHVAQSVLHVTKALKVPDQSIVVTDVGCGMAELYVWLTKRRWAAGSSLIYQGIDIDPWKLNAIKELLPRELADGRVRLFECDLEKSWPDNMRHANAMIFTEVLEHLNPGCMSMLLEEMRNYTDWLVGTSPTPGLGMDVEWHVKEYTRQQQQDLFESAGWNLVFDASLQVRYNSQDPWACPYADKTLYRQLKGMADATQQGVMPFWVYHA
jgi:hypothetical protein